MHFCLKMLFLTYSLSIIKTLVLKFEILKRFYKGFTDKQIQKVEPIKPILY